MSLSIQQTPSTKLFESYIPSNFKDFITSCMKSFQCSAHDEDHCHRVVNLAVKIASTESKADIKVVMVAALCHDVLDLKLQTDDMSLKIQDILRTKILEFMTDSECILVMDIVETIGYKNLLKKDWHPETRSIEYRCVQDADLLDAIGSIGVSRCYAFGGMRNRDLFGLDGFVKVETNEQYMAQRTSTGAVNLSNLQHFFDKLLRIKSMMTTDEGKRLAKVRHNTMITFLLNLAQELNEAGSVDGSLLYQLLESDENGKQVE